MIRCHHHRQGSAPSFSNSSQTGGGGGSGVCTELLLELEPLLDDDEEPLDELPDEDDDDDDDVVLSSSLSTSFFARRGLSLTPPRRGLSLMPRESIVYVGRRRMVGMGMGAVRLSCPSMFCAAVEAQGSSKHLGAGPWGWARWLGRPASLERSSVRGNGLRRLCAALTSCGCLLVSYRTLAFVLLLCFDGSGTAVKVVVEPSFVAAVDVLHAANAQTNLVACGRCQSLCSHPAH